MPSLLDPMRHIHVDRTHPDHDPRTEKRKGEPSDEQLLQERSNASSLFFEIFQDTSTGDIGVQLTCGVLFRCHREVLVECGGLLQRIRSFPQLPIDATHDESIVYHETYIKKHPTKVNQDLLELIGFAAFSRSEAASMLGNSKGTMRGQADGLYYIGKTTATELSGALGSEVRRDPFVMAERYLIDEEYEHFFELLHFAYRGEFSYSNVNPTNHETQVEKVRDMREMLYLSARFAVDPLFDECVEWFTHHCMAECGAQPFLEAFFQLEHYVSSIQEPMSYAQLYDALLCILSIREQFETVTQDPRWASLHVDFMETVLRDDRLAIHSEAEILGLIDRWNASADKPKPMIIRLLSAFRPDMVSVEKLKAGGAVSDVVQRLLDNAETNLPRGGNGVKHMTRTKEQAAYFGAEDAEKENEQIFALYEGDTGLEEGYSFLIKVRQVVLQRTPMHCVGTRRLRVTIKQPHYREWQKDHEIFCGVAFGSNRYFGFVVKLSDFAGIYALQEWSSAQPLPLAPKHVSGSGNKVEFDLLLSVGMPQINEAVPCSLTVIASSQTIAFAPFEIANITLVTGPGVRFQFVASGLGLRGEGVPSDELELLIAWVGGGDADKPPLTLD